MKSLQNIDTWCIFFLRVIPHHVHPLSKSSSIQACLLAVSRDTEGSNPDSLLLALVVITSELGHRESSMGTHGASFCYVAWRSKSNQCRTSVHPKITNLVAVTRDTEGNNHLTSTSITPHDTTATIIHNKAVQYNMHSGSCMSDGFQKSTCEEVTPVGRHDVALNRDSSLRVGNAQFLE
jgi:hypothetical protein